MQGGEREEGLGWPLRLWKHPWAAPSEVYALILAETLPLAPKKCREKTSTEAVHSGPQFEVGLRYHGRGKLFLDWRVGLH